MLGDDTPAAHAEVATAALRAGKHVYGEKPLTLDPAAGERLLAEAASRGLRVGNAPDTFWARGSRRPPGPWTPERSASRSR